MPTDTASMQQYMQYLAREHRRDAVGSGIMAGGMGTATGVAGLSGPWGLAAIPPLAYLTAIYGADAMKHIKGATRADRGADMWSQTGLPEGPHPDEWRNKLSE